MKFTMEAERNHSITRRQLVSAAGALAGAGFFAKNSQAQDHAGHEGHGAHGASIAASPGMVAQSTGRTEIFSPPGITYKPVTTPNGATLPWKMVDGVKVFHLIAEPVTHEFIPAMEGHTSLVAQCWGYNGRVHGPTIEAVEGDRVRIYVTNKLPASTTVHWHGALLPSGMDGVGGVSQKSIQPGETFKYEFTLRQHGTLMYHSHHDEMTQMQLGMMGMFIIHPRETEKNPPDRDYAFMLSEWKIEVGARRPDPNEMTELNVFTLNGRSFPGTQPILAKKGDRVRIRIGNLSTMSHHAIHLHGYQFNLIATDGGHIPQNAQWPETTVHMPTGSTRTIEFIADEPGDWVMHCHMLHHLMTQMGHRIGNLIGMDKTGLNQRIRKLIPGYMVMGESGMGDMGDMGMAVPPNSLPMIGGQGKYDYITMGGMFTILKVRESLPADGSDPGWYECPPGTMAVNATPDELRHDGISP